MSADARHADAAQLEDETDRNAPTALAAAALTASIVLLVGATWLAVYVVQRAGNAGLLAHQVGTLEPD